MIFIVLMFWVLSATFEWVAFTQSAPVVVRIIFGVMGLASFLGPFSA